MYQSIMDLTKELVAIPSVNGTAGERAIVDHIEKRLRTIPYFARHPEYVILQEMGDHENRANVFAIVKGEKRPSGDTVILHGHIDTVGTEDYAGIEPYAFDCDALPEKIRALTDDPDVLADIDSGEWLFGRGVADMKSGVAVHYCIAEYYANHPDRLEGNIVFMANPVEENQHTGIMASLRVLKELIDREGLRYVMAINTDMFTPRYPGDRTKYFHAGSVGKLLPCFYIMGKPTHVSQYFDGLSASLTAAEIVKRLDGNTDYTEDYYGEHAQPPTVLKMKDLKPSYNVQTATAAFVYFNYFLLGSSIDALMERLKTVARDALDAVLAHTDAQFKKYGDRFKDEKYTGIRLQTQVLSYSELYGLAKGKCGDVEARVAEITQKCLAENMDRRELCRTVVEVLCVTAEINIPTVVVFIAPPYCPRNTMKPESPDEKALWDRVSGILNRKAEEVGEVYRLLHFFTGLSDSSYIKMDDDDASVRCLIENFPEFKEIYNVPVDLIRELSIPAFDFGVLGKDAHMWTERLHMPYSFGRLPELIMAAAEGVLSGA
ncbi:MAG: M20/M25/M40 family metallo-hydrolase [Clostridiales Family XIII bacterium]|nr:M20/M25/M40 family metallo-hydrolase [Clostridiales Family XIII bacterium]